MRACDGIPMYGRGSARNETLVFACKRHRDMLGFPAIESSQSPGVEEGRALGKHGARPSLPPSLAQGRLF
jgi:hypothetical protein